jgi:translocation and assembly module TamB
MNDLTADPAAGPTPGLAPPSPRDRPRHVGLWLRLALWLSLLLGAGWGLGWVLGTQAGTAWVLSQLPGVEVQNPQGLLLGDFEAQRIRVQLPTPGHTLTFTGLGWRGLSANPSRTGFGLQWSVQLADLHVSRIELNVPPTDSAPLSAPSHFKMPFELVVHMLRVAEIQHSALPGQPLRDLQAKLHFSAAGGTQHRIENASVNWEGIWARGALSVATRAPLTVNVTAGLAQAAQGLLPAWSAALALQGPLASPVLHAAVRTTAPPELMRSPQWLDVQATLHPFASWPLGLVQARMQALDLSIFSPRAPVTALSGQAVATRGATHESTTLQLELSNTQAGLWSEHRVPLHRLQLLAQIPGTSIATHAAIHAATAKNLFVLQDLQAELGTSMQPAGRLTAQGQWQAGQWSLNAQLHGVRPSGLDARAPRMQLQGAARVSGRMATPTAAAELQLNTQLQGLLATSADTAFNQAAQLKLQARVAPDIFEVKEAQFQAGKASASLSGVVTRASAQAPWRAQAQGILVNFDPAVWWPGPTRWSWRQADNHLNGQATVDMTLPFLAASPGASELPWAQRLGALRGQARLSLDGSSALVGVPLAGEWALRGVGNQPLVSNSMWAATPYK